MFPCYSFLPFALDEPTFGDGRPGARKTRCIDLVKSAEPPTEMAPEPGAILLRNPATTCLVAIPTRPDHHTAAWGNEALANDRALVGISAAPVFVPPAIVVEPTIPVRPPVSAST